MPEHVHTYPVDASLSSDEAWHELCLMGVRATDTGSETWANIRCDGEECWRIADGRVGHRELDPVRRAQIRDAIFGQSLRSG